MSKILVICQNSPRAGMVGGAYFDEHSEDHVRGRRSYGPMVGKEIMFVGLGASIIGHRFDRIIEYDIDVEMLKSEPDIANMSRWLAESQLRLIMGSLPNVKLDPVQWGTPEELPEAVRRIRHYVVNPQLP